MKLDHCNSLPCVLQVRINVSGQTFETMRRTLEKYPNTLLGSDERDYFYDSDAGEYFFDRDPSLFRYVLAYYRSVYSLYHTGISFYSARNARIASAVLATAIPSVRPSVRSSVSPSVCPSHAGIVSKRRHIARCSLHRWIAKCV